MLTRTALLFGFAASAAVCNASDADACSCADWSTAERFDNAHVVFEGTVVRQHEPVEALDGSGRYLDPFEFELEDAWKGVDAGGRVVVYSGPASTCAGMFDADRWIVFAHRPEPGPHNPIPEGGLLGSPVCGGAVRSSWAGSAEIREELDALAGRRKGCRVTGSSSTWAMWLVLLPVVARRRRLSAAS
jgi:hypothetical protein